MVICTSDKKYRFSVSFEKLNKQVGLHMHVQFNLLNTFLKGHTKSVHLIRGTYVYTIYYHTVYVHELGAE